MPKELKKYISTIQQIISVIIFVVLLFNQTLSHASIWVIVSFYCWIFICLYFNTFRFQQFIKVFCRWGMLYAIIIFFKFAVEEVPYPEGAIYFHINYIALSVALFFISSIPLMFMKNKEANTYINKIMSVFNNITTKEANLLNESWEEASIEDIESEDFEPI